jgi:phenylpropionate dioxygenase-like ring-hydroxylating dioxygenase large terminal subunit
VFIRLDAGGESLADWLGPVAGRLAPYRFDEHVCADRRSTGVAANWKTVCDAFLEAYHVQGIHPQLLPGLDDVNTTYEVWDRHSAMVMPYAPSPKAPQRTELERLEALGRASGYGAGRLLRDAGLRAEVGDKIADGATLRDTLIEVVRKHLMDQGFPVDGLGPSQMLDDHHYFIFPNLVLNIHAGHYTLMRFRPDAADPERSVFDMFHFRWETGAGREAYPRKDMQWFDDPTGQFGEIAEQDFENLSTVQRGMHSRALTHTTLCRHEQRILAFHRTVDAFVFGRPGAGNAA